MVWEPASQLSSHNHTRRGLAAAVRNGMICQEATRLSEDRFQAISLRDGVLKVAVKPGNLAKTKLIEGKVLRALNRYCQERGFPRVTRFRLTEEPSSGNV